MPDEIPIIVKVLNNAVSAVTHYGDDAARLEMCIEIAKEWAEINRHEDAKSILKKRVERADSIDDNAAKEHALTKIVTAQCELGYFEEALEAAKLIPIEEGRTPVLVNIAKAIRKREKPNAETP